MNKCEHGEKITKFCVTEHCHHKEAAGCDYCIRKYHFHLTSTLLLTEADIELLLKNLTLPSDIKFKARNLQETALDYLRTVKTIFNTWIQQAQNSIAERLTHPTLRKNNLLNAFNRLKQKDYRKINAKELRTLNEFAKVTPPELLKKEELDGYFRQVDWTFGILTAAQKMAVQICKLPEVREGDGQIPLANKDKVNAVYESIQKEKSRKEGQPRVSVESNSRGEILKLQENSLMKKRQSRQKRESPPNGEMVKEFVSVLERKTIDYPTAASEISKTQAQEANERQKQANNIFKESNQQKQKRLKRRRSSIDYQIDMKFGAAIDEKAKEFKDNEDKRKQVITGRVSWEQKKPQTGKIEKKEETKPKTQAKQKKEIEDNIIGNLLNLKLANKQLVTIKEEKEKVIVNSNSTEQMKMGPVEKVGIKRQQSQLSSNKNKSSESNISDFTKGFMDTLINNVLPPLPPQIPKNREPNEPVYNMVFKIPVMKKDILDEIQSPIFRNKRKIDKQNVKNGFGLMAVECTSGEAIVEDGQKLSVVKQAPGEESSVPVILKPAEVVKETVEEPMVLQRNQKNSLLLFSEALSSSSERAAQLLKAALKYSPQNLSAAEYLSYLYLQDGKAKECLQVCEAILVLIEDSPEEFEVTLHLHNNKAAALNQLGRYSESIMILQKCLRYRRKHYFYKNLGDAYFSLGIPEKAAMNYEKAVKLYEQYDEAYYNLAVTQFIQEEYSSAQLNARNALRLQGDNESYQELSKEIEKRIENLSM